MNSFPFMTRTQPALSRGELSEGYNRAAPAYRRDSVQRVNFGKRTETQAASQPNARPSPAAAATPPLPPPRPLPLPELLRPLQRGEKASLQCRPGERAALRFACGWNVLDGRCDVDISAFLLAANGRVPGDEWFVFYGQTQSPDGAVRLREGGGSERRIIEVDLSRLNPAIERIAFVLTIDEAVQRKLNFGMIREVWLRALDASNREILSYRPQDLAPQITSMTLAEMYLRRGEWRFNPVGNGLNIDLAGQCAVYGVNIG